MAILTGTGISQADVDLLSRNFALNFPDDYKDFMKDYNGFWIESPGFCNIPFDKVDNGYISFDGLFGYQVNNKNFDIAVINDEFLSELSFLQNAFIIGTDPGDNFYVLVTEGQRAGVYYWDRTCLHTEDHKQNYAISGEEDSQHLYLCDGKFERFFEKIMALTVKNGMGTLTCSLLINTL